MRYTNAPSHGTTMMNRPQIALPHPDNSWSRKMSAKIEMSSQIQANRSMNQKIDRMMSQKFMTGLPLAAGGGCSLRTISILEPGLGRLTRNGRSRWPTDRLDVVARGVRPSGVSRPAATAGGGDGWAAQAGARA